VRSVEDVVLAEKGVSTVYTRSGDMGQGSQDITEDVIGKIQFEFTNWKTRPTANQIMADLRSKTASLPGIKVEVTAEQAGTADRQAHPGPALEQLPRRADRRGQAGDG
jgi:multidrug efflux pump